MSLTGKKNLKVASQAFKKGNKNLEYNFKTRRNFEFQG
jgi:hypothetical protein